MSKSKNLALFAAATAFATLAPQARAQDGADSAPYYQSGPWTVWDRAKIFCAIERADDPVGRLVISKSSTEEAYFSFRLSERKAYYTPSVGVSWLFDAEPVAGRILAGQTYQVAEDRHKAEALFRKAMTLKIMHEDETVAEVDLSGSAAAFRKLEECSDQYPGSRVPMIPPPAPPLTRAVPPASTPIPEPDLEGPFKPEQSLAALRPDLWVRAADYRSQWLRAGIEGRVGITLVISNSGRVDSCQVTQSSGHPYLDEYTCDLVSRRARFQPATDGNAKRIGGTFSTNVNWQIPD